MDTVVIVLVSLAGQPQWGVLMAATYVCRRLTQILMNGSNE